MHWQGRHITAINCFLHLLHKKCGRASCCVTLLCGRIPAPTESNDSFIDSELLLMAALILGLLVARFLLVGVLLMTVGLLLSNVLLLVGFLLMGFLLVGVLFGFGIIGLLFGHGWILGILLVGAILTGVLLVHRLLLLGSFSIAATCLSSSSAFNTFNKKCSVEHLCVISGCSSKTLHDLMSSVLKISKLRCFGRILAVGLLRTAKKSVD
jgi:MFS family permease